MTHVVGIDCATQPKKTGMVLASWEAGKLRIEESALGSEQIKPIDRITVWIGRHPIVLLALDAPLGWPRPLGDVLVRHRAGQALPEERNRLFRRATDDFIKERLGKRPLDVGADRIARTAHAALELLEEVRKRTGKSVPLVWEAKSFNSVGAILETPRALTSGEGYSLASSIVQRASLPWEPKPSPHSSGDEPLYSRRAFQ